VVALEARLALRQTQRLVMTPMLQQAIHLLQLSTLELQEVLQKELTENPVLEEVPPEEEPTAEETALAVLDLTPPATLAEIKQRYKALVKRLHPDANGGDTAAEERLKLVNQAYSMLKTAALA